MTVLIVGSKGQLGCELVEKMADNGFDLTAVDIDELDITNPAAVDEAICGNKLSVVVNTAAYTAVDKAESEPDLTYGVNRDGPANLAGACAKAHVPLIHISTDYVFDGRQKSAYREDDPVSPLGVYGRSKAAGDDEIRKHLKEHIILRTAWLYGRYGHNFVKTILNLARERDELQVVDDQYGCPTNAVDLADAILAIIRILREKREPLWGTYHYCGQGRTSWHGFARAILEMARTYEEFKVKSIIPIPTTEYPFPTERPANSVLDCSRIQRRLGIYPRKWQEGLKEMLNAHYKL